QVCDRWLASEKYLAIAHFIGGVALVSIPIATEMYRETQDNFGALLTLVGIYAVAYFPTVPLASALTFRHLPHPDAQFGAVRIGGTVGWVLAGLLLSLWLGQRDAYVWLSENYPQWKPQLDQFQVGFSWMRPPSSSDCFSLAALLSFALSSFCIFLPATPPARKPRGTVAPLQTLAMFRNRTFSLLIAISFLLAMVVPLYTLEMPDLLQRLGYPSDWVPAVMTVGQISEFPALLLLPFCLKRFGLKATFALGMAAWMIRYAIFALMQPTWLILTGIGLHGVCHVFLIIVVQLYVDAQTRPDLRTSAQNLFAFITAGIATPIGFVLGGLFGKWCEHEVTGRMNYHLFFALPAVLILGLLIAYLKWFRL
ncbi:MAG TPA: MFS transporter, partial [Roseiflexaceae bacterium]|nr:MFS transporter [Roseiflexaceae bacterium]